MTRATMLAWVFKPRLQPSRAFAKLKGFAYLANFIAGVRFVNGVEKIEDQQISTVARLIKLRTPAASH